jgi:CRISPR/Cas system endoribonuclease Cas6 (RAMP superfamily)
LNVQEESSFYFFFFIENRERKQLTSMSSLDAILLDSEGTENFIRGLMSSLVYSTKASNSIPGDEGEC